MRGLVSVSVDLDELCCYHDIHGLADVPDRAARAVYSIAVPRLLDLFDRLALPATFFVVGRDLDPAIGAPAARRIARAGHEVGNHSLSHRYDLLELGPAARWHEVAHAGDAIAEALGERPRGFRAPGYNVDDALLRLLAELGYAYDSSIFPSAPYYSAKAAAMASMRLRGRESRSLLGPPQVLLAPTEPYRVAGSFWRRAEAAVGLVELPVAVLPVSRLPFIGTALTMAGPGVAAAMARAASCRRFVGLELHGIDALDDSDRGATPLSPHQPDLRIPVARKLAALEAALTALREEGLEFVSSAEAAARAPL